jgi:hypothetical protein
MASTCSLATAKAILHAGSSLPKSFLQPDTLNNFTPGTTVHWISHSQQPPHTRDTRQQLLKASGLQQGFKSSIFLHPYVQVHVATLFLSTM